MDEIVKGQLKNSMLRKLAEEVNLKQRIDYVVRSDGALMKHGRLCVPNDLALKSAILEEAHSSAYAMHPNSTKMYRTLKGYYWWPGMKREIAEFVVRCLICQQVKPKRQRLGGLLNPLPVSISLWISYLVFLKPRVVMMEYG